MPNRGGGAKGKGRGTESSQNKQLLLNKNAFFVVEIEV
jgi:hypothetical protein